MKDSSILDEAKNIVYGARQEAYGHPSDDFSRTATLWSEILHTTVLARDVALCMIALKLSREVNKHDRDNLVDIAGYAATIERLDEATKEEIPFYNRPFKFSDWELHSPGCKGVEDDCRA